jgi:hypothetical protein
MMEKETNCNTLAPHNAPDEAININILFPVDIFCDVENKTEVKHKRK